MNTNYKIYVESNSYIDGEDKTIIRPFKPCENTFFSTEEEAIEYLASTWIGEFIVLPVIKIES